MEALLPSRDVPTAMVALITAGLSILITWFVVTRYVKRAIVKVIAGMQRIARGDLGFRLTVRHNDKFSVVADTFNDMASKLELLLQRLRETKDYVEGIVESSLHPDFQHRSRDHVGIQAGGSDRAADREALC
jgi:methyl-accepting chemotaxis protein